METKADLRCDFLVEDIIFVEIKSVAAMSPVFDAQTISYMNLAKKPKGILFNFNELNLYNEGQKALVNDIYRRLPDV